MPVLNLREVDVWFIDRVLPHERRYVAQARRFCANGDEALDMVHDVYARLLASEGWRFIDEPSVYVLTMVYNLGVQTLRRARVVAMESLTEAQSQRLAAPQASPFEETAGRQGLRLALAAMRDLPPRCREVVELRRLHDLSPRDIARRLGLSLSTVEKRLARGMVLMAQALSGAEAPSPAEASRTGRSSHRREA